MLWEKFEEFANDQFLDFLFKVIVKVPRGQESPGEDLIKPLQRVLPGAPAEAWGFGGEMTPAGSWLSSPLCQAHLLMEGSRGHVPWHTTPELRGYSPHPVGQRASRNLGCGCICHLCVRRCRPRFAGHRSHVAFMPHYCGGCLGLLPVPVVPELRGGRVWPCHAPVRPVSAGLPHHVPVPGSPLAPNPRMEGMEAVTVAVTVTPAAALVLFGVDCA